MIFLVTGCGKKKGLNISNEEIALKLNISPEQLDIYLNDESTMPENLPSMLQLAYTDLIRSSTTIQVQCTVEDDALNEE